MSSTFRQQLHSEFSSAQILSIHFNPLRTLHWMRCQRHQQILSYFWLVSCEDPQKAPLKISDQMDEDTGPVLICAGITISEEIASRELRKRGFIVKHCHARNSTNNFAVTMSKRLTTKLAAENDMELRPILDYSTFEQLSLANQAVKVIQRAGPLKCTSCWVAHDHTKRQVEDSMSNLKKDSNAALIAINSYYGPQIALYYGFMKFYIKSLVPPMIAGVLLFLHQCLSSQIDSVYLPIFCLAITLWSTFFLERWKRHCAELAYRWGVYGAEDKELTAELAKGASKEVSSVEVRRTLSWIGVLVLVLLQVNVMLYYNYIQSNYASYVGNEWYSQAVPAVVYYGLCNLSSALLYPITTILTDFEMHPTKAEAEGSLVIKHFTLTFVSEFSALFYAAFVLKDLARVRILSILSFAIHAGSIQIFQFFLPKVKHAFRKRQLRRQQSTMSTKNGLDSADSGQDSNKHNTISESRSWDDVIHREIKQSEFELDTDYLEMIIQFGHLSMFAVAFPLAPLLAYVNNRFEIVSDFKKLVHARRPPIVIRSSIGAWLTCLQFLSFASVFTNCYLIAIVSINIKAIIPSMLHSFIDSDYGRLATMMLVEHLLIALKVGIMVLVDDVPQWMQESLARDRVREEQERLSALFGASNNADDTSTGPESAKKDDTRRSSEGGSFVPNFTGLVSPNGLSRAFSNFNESTPPSTPTANDTSNNNASNATTASGNRNSLPASLPSMGNRRGSSLMKGISSLAHQASRLDRSFVSEQLAAEENLLGKPTEGKRIKLSRYNPAQSDAAATKLMAQCGNSYGFDPLNLSALIALPPLFQHFGLSSFFYVPIAVMYFSYLQAAKDRMDRKTAIGIVSDPTLIKLVVQDLPKWVSDSEHQRVEWFNALLQKLWPQLSSAMEATIIEQIQAQLNAQQLAVRVGLHVKRFTLGTVSPKIVSIRLHETQESAVRLDLEIRWAGDALLCITMGHGSFSPPVEVSELRLSALIRIELLDLMPQLPCFRALSVTFMKKPEVHFSLKVATLDFMNMGPADFNVASLVRSAINAALKDIVVYPKKIVIPMVATNEEDEENSALEEPGTAVGVLYLTFDKGVNIKKAGLFGSNPYVSARTDKNQTFRSRAVYGSRNPEWKQTFECLVFDPATQVVEVQVLDADPTRAGVCLGRLNFHLSNLKPSQSVRTTVELQDVEQGSVVLTYEYIPLVVRDVQDSDEGEEASDLDDDVIFNPSMAKGDVLCESDEEAKPQQTESRKRGRTRSKIASMLTPEQLAALKTLSEEAGSPTKPTSGTSTAGSTPAPTTPAPARTLLRGAALRNPAISSVSRRDMSVKYSVGIVSVSMIHVRNLKFDSFFQSVTKPYVRLQIGESVKRTKPLPGSTFPHYPEKFTFIVKDVAEQDLRVVVMNKNTVRTDQLLGSVDIALLTVLQSEGTLEQEYILHGIQAEFYVGLRISITGASS